MVNGSPTICGPLVFLVPSLCFPYVGFHRVFYHTRNNHIPFVLVELSSLHKGESLSAGHITLFVLSVRLRHLPEPSTSPHAFSQFGPYKYLSQTSNPLFVWPFFLRREFSVGIIPQTHSFIVTYHKREATPPPARMPLRNVKSISDYSAYTGPVTTGAVIL